MFGIITASLSTLPEEERVRYNELYCGLCRALRDRYGQISRATLNFDLTFYIILANSLHEPIEERGESHCITHPKKKMPYARTRYTDYAADITVALAYHKCLDDWHDDRSKKARTAQALLENAYARAQENIPEQCDLIRDALAQISRLESDPDTPPDAAAIVFGALFGKIFAADQGIWQDAMRTFGAQLGRFIYMMDAAIDYEDDRKSGSYNPFAKLQLTPENMKTLLAVFIGEAANTFEKLPLEQDLHLMQSVLYSGVWQAFNKKYQEELHTIEVPIKDHGKTNRKKQFEQPDRQEKAS